MDNGSKDESIEKIKEYCKGKIEVNSKFFKYSDKNKPIEIIEYDREETKDSLIKEREVSHFASNRRLLLIKNEKNYGFAEGNNIGMRYALRNLNPKYVLLLNNDTVVDPEFLTELVKVGESDEKVGIVGPKIYYYDYNRRDDIIWCAGGKIYWWRELVYSHIGQNKQDTEQYNSPKEVNWISGAVLMTTSINLENLSLFNSKYFFGNEDVEFCIKTHRKGLGIIYTPTSKVWHKVGISRAETGIKTRNFGDYFSFLRQYFSLSIYIYHIILFITIILPKCALSYIIKYRDKETFHSFILNVKEIFFKSKKNKK